MSKCSAIVSARRSGGIRRRSACARSLKLPVLATNGVRYATAYDREILDLFTAIRHHVELDQAGRLLALNNQRHLRGRERWRRSSAMCRERSKTRRTLVALRFNWTISAMSFRAIRCPTARRWTAFSEACRRRRDAAVWPKNDRALLERAKKQVEHELELIAQSSALPDTSSSSGTSSILQKNDILIQGRGSAANSAVCYALEITAIDPVGMELLFERFLSESRGEWPDIDLDLPSEDKREQAIQYVYQRYGELGAAMTANVITYRGKSAARRLARRWASIKNRWALSSLVSQWEWRGKTDTMAHSFQNAGFDSSIRASRSISNSRCGFRTCRAIWDSTRAAW
jgi:error-prone DNA polymerase